MVKTTDETIVCAECNEELHKGGRVYLDGKEYHENCFNAEDNNDTHDYFTTRKGFYR